MGWGGSVEGGLVGGGGEVGGLGGRAHLEGREGLGSGGGGGGGGEMELERKRKKKRRRLTIEGWVARVGATAASVGCGKKERKKKKN